jgi:hypothetical protein
VRHEFAEGEQVGFTAAHREAGAVTGVRTTTVAAVEAVAGEARASTNST